MPLALQSPYPRIVTLRWGGRPELVAAHRIAQAIEETIVLILVLQNRLLCLFCASLGNCNVSNLRVFISAEGF